jgi:hypothetical protein
MRFGGHPNTGSSKANQVPSGGIPYNNMGDSAGSAQSSMSVLLTQQEGKVGLSNDLRRLAAS